jgi:hypothetical protein
MLGAGLYMRLEYYFTNNAAAPCKSARLAFDPSKLPRPSNLDRVRAVDFGFHPLCFD